MITFKLNQIFFLQVDLNRGNLLCFDTVIGFYLTHFTLHYSLLPFVYLPLIGFVYIRIDKAYVVLWRGVIIFVAY